MISIQTPQFASSFFPHYAMSEPSIPQIMSNPSHPLSKPATSLDGHSSGSDTKARQARPGAKSRPSRAGTRSVSTLTAAQLERKRANDREAQRAIRQRTKDHIENLERRIAELTATDDTSQKLMQALQRNEELEQECAILRSRLNHAVAAMGGVPGAEGIPSPDPSLLGHGTLSPQNRMRMQPAPRAQPTSTPRQDAPPTMSAAVSQAGSWTPHSGYSSPATSSIGDASIPSPATNAMRWPHASAVPASAPEAERAYTMDASVPPPVSYSYVLDSSGRPMYQSESQTMSYPPPTASPQPHTIPSDYPRYQGAPVAPVAPVQSNPAYTTYPSHPGFITTSPHPDQSVPMMQRTPVENHHTMYAMPQDNQPQH